MGATSGERAWTGLKWSSSAAGSLGRASRGTWSRLGAKTCSCSNARRSRAKARPGRAWAACAPSSRPTSISGCPCTRFLFMPASMSGSASRQAIVRRDICSSLLVRRTSNICRQTRPARERSVWLPRACFQPVRLRRNIPSCAPTTYSAPPSARPTVLSIRTAR